MTNYYYDPASAGLEMLAFEDHGARDDYGFDILAFWVDKDGVVYSASDSGCSCPSPFEDYTSMHMLERVGSVEQAEATFYGWNSSYGSTKVDPHEVRKLLKWFEDKSCPLWTEMYRLYRRAAK